MTPHSSAVALPHATRLQATHPFTARRALAALAAILATLLGGCASAHHATALAGPDRPGYSFGTATVPTHGVQVEVGYTDTRAGSQSYHSVGEGLVRVGVGASTELRGFANSYGIRSDATIHQRGFEDTKVGIKQRLHAGHGTTGFGAASVALLAGTTLPTGSASFGAGVWQPEALLAASIPATAKLSFVPNVGDVYVVQDGERAHRALVSLAGWYAFSGTFSTFAEYAGSQITSTPSTRLHYADAGVAFVPVPTMQLDVRYGHGMNALPNDHYVGLGITRRW
jgi:hypothetical protein